MRTVERMGKFFESIRKTGLRRGPRRLVAGVGGGVADKLRINVWVARLLILVSFLLPVLGIGAYIVVWILTPWQDGRIPLERAFGRRRDSLR
jgi:phage shock protein PspC (stress-responsive transcriptional regulator)